MAQAQDLKIKMLGHIEIKNESTGEVEAIIATLNVVDHDREVILPDAIKSGSRVALSSYGHDAVGFLAAGLLPVGKGAVFIEDNKAVFRGKVFVSTERGRETLEVLKEMGNQQQWSFGFHVIGSEEPDDAWRKKGAMRILTKLDVFEVSPVVIGAGIGTRTVAAKEADEEATRVKAEQEAADQVAAEQAAAEKATADAEAKEAAAVETAQREAATKAAAEADAEAQKVRAADAVEEFHRVQRALKRLGVA